MDPSNTKLHKQIGQVPESRRTTEARISAISKNVSNNLVCDLQNCIPFNLALNESKDIQDVLQLTIFIRFVHPDVNVKEEMLYQVTFIETTRSVDVINAPDKEMNKF